MDSHKTSFAVRLSRLKIHLYLFGEQRVVLRYYSLLQIMIRIINLKAYCSY